MATLNIIYYTGTGNTGEMAKYIGEGAENAGATVKLINVEEADESAVDADFIAFGSPAVGAEEIAPEMVEFFEGIKDKIIGKTNLGKVIHSATKNRRENRFPQNFRIRSLWPSADYAWFILFQKFHGRCLRIALSQKFSAKRISNSDG